MISEVISLLTSKRYDDAYFAIIEIINNQAKKYDEALDLLFSNFSSEKSLNYEKVYIQSLEKRNLHIKIIEYLETKDELSIKDKIILIRNYKKIGKLKEFRKLLDEILQKILIEKNYNIYSDLKLEFSNELKNKSAYLITDLTVALDVGDDKKVTDLLDLIILSYEKQEFGAENLIRVTSDLVINYDTKYLLNSMKSILKIDLVNTILKNENYSNKKKLEYFLLCEDAKDYYPLLELEENENLIHRLKLLIGGVSLKNIPVVYKKTRSLNMARISMNSKAITKEKSILKKENPILRESTEKIHISDDELDENVDIRYDSEQQDLESIVLAMIEMKLYSKALEASNKMTESLNKHYLQAVIENKMNNYTESIYILNNILNENRLHDEEKLPFIYLKMENFRSLKKDEYVKKYLNQISKINPNYRRIRGD